MNEKIKDNRIVAALILELSFIIMGFFAHCGVQSLSLMSIKDSSRYLILNVILLYCLYKLTYLIFNRLWISYLISGVIWFALGAVNHYVGEFRGVMLLPWDILAVRTAAHVADTYEYSLYPQELLWLVFILVTAFAAKKYHRPLFTGKQRVVYAAVSLALLSLVMGLMLNSSRYREIPDRLYLIERYYRTQGITVSFFHYCDFLFHAAPEGYSVGECEKIVEEYSDGTGDYPVTDRAKNIIVIMNEAFADFRTLGGLPEAEDATRFFHSISENAITGNLYVPVFGGTTVNSEYEFLTGNSIAYQKGCPLSYAVREERPSVASYLKNKGFEVHAFHPAAAVNWNREGAYPLLGMEDFLSIESFEGQDIPVVNGHPTDEWDYSELIKLYENKKSDKFFVFNVTMQNHSGYDFEFPEWFEEGPADLSEYGDYPQGENYLGLIRQSDKAFKGLIEYFEKVDEPTLIVMFGDHQPKLEDDFSAMVYSLSHEEAFDANDPVDNIKKYCTPFVIWANYDIEEKDYEMISSNYLSGLVLEAAGIETYPFQRLLSRLREKYPVFGVNGVIDTAGNLYAPDELEKDGLVRSYKYLEYNNVNDSGDNLLWDAFE